VLAREGVDIVVDYGHRRAPALDTVRAIGELGGRAIAVRADVSRARDVTHLVDRTLATYGRLDILVNNAGIVGNRPFLDLDEYEWDRVLDVNLKGAYLCARAAAQVMVAQGTHGRIVHVGSVHSTRSLPGRSHYAASKAGLVGMNRVMSYELAPHGITCNVIAPGATYSEEWGDTLDDPAEVRRIEAAIPLGRIGNPADMGEAVLFLVSPGADYITGVCLDVDGGLLTSPTHV
jgi:NAD(P)-dependent dehydrogenase (short-subunit alcohol dehydrogenase family)